MKTKLKTHLVKKPRNKFEKRTNQWLRRRKVKFKYEAKKIAYVIASHYIPDFLITTPNGEIIVETKGYLRPEDKRKLVAVKKCNPQLDIRILFYSLNKSYTRWADRHGFKWAVGTIPEEWLEGL